MSQVWIPNFSNHLVLAPVERKVQVIGMTKLMCESAEVFCKPVIAGRGYRARGGAGGGRAGGGEYRLERYTPIQQPQAP